MFRFKPKRHDPKEIAQTVLEVAREASNIAAFWQEFASSENEFPRVIFSAIIFAYCWSWHWSVGTQNSKDPQVLEAYRGAAQVIISRFKDSAKRVSVSEYVLSEFEITNLYLALDESFHQRIRQFVDPAADNDTLIRATSGATRAYSLPLAELAMAVVTMRSERMKADIRGCLPIQDEWPTFSILADTLYEQISGIARFSMPRDHALHDLRDEKNSRQARVIRQMIDRLDTRLREL